MNGLLPIIALIIFVCLFGGGLLLVAALLGPYIRSLSSIKKSTYECGIAEQDAAHARIPVRFYMTAILFILFDIEIVFMYPWALAYSDFLSEGNGLYILSAMLFFILLFVIGLIWEVKSKALEWD